MNFNFNIILLMLIILYLYATIINDVFKYSLSRSTFSRPGLF